MNVRLALAAVLACAFCFAAPEPKSWSGFAGDAQHTARAPAAAQDLRQIHWQTPVDLLPQYSGSDLLIHYGSPLVTAANTVIVPVKTGETGGFRVEARNGADGSLEWSLPSDYILPEHNWTPVFGPALTPEPRLYFPGAGGTVYFRDRPDSADGAQGQIAFYGLANYLADPRAYDANVTINTPLTSGPSGAIYFGFLVTGPTPVPLASGFARIGPDGEAAWIPVTTAAADETMKKVAFNCAPALSPNLDVLYIAVSDGASGYLVALDSRTLAPMARVRLTDPRSGLDSVIWDDGSASPTIGPDGDVYFGVLENPFPGNQGRGWLLHFDGGLSRSKIPGAFGWDTTASLIPASMIPAYQGVSSYLLMTKYNNYAGLGGDGVNKLAILDPNGADEDSVMSEVLTMPGPTPDGEPPAVMEWCINSAAVDPESASILAHNEDGKLYRWDLSTNTLSQTVVLSTGLGEAYTPTAIGVDGQVYAISNGTLFAVGR